MKQKIIKNLLAVTLTAAMVVGLVPTTSWDIQAATDLATAVEEGLSIEASEINKLLTKNLTLPKKVTGLSDATVTYSVDSTASKYVTVDGNKLEITRPYAGDGDFKFDLTATVAAEDGSTYSKKFPLTIREGLSDDSLAGYLYVSFAVERVNESSDVQQLHFFLSEDGLNWTAVNGCNPVFLAGEDYASNIVSCGPQSVNYEVAPGTDVSKTVTGDASVLFPFEGDDQGVRDPYLIRGCRADGSDAGKTWILATDLNTHDAENYNGNKENNVCGNWGLTNVNGSTNLFVWETEDYVNWTRRYIDVGSEVDACMAWAPEAIYNPVKDNYLVYWSARTTVDGKARDRVYCNETKDFVTFGPTKLYEQDAFYKNYGASGKSNNSGYGTIDTSMLWVADETGNPYGTLFRLTKDETNNHIELYSSDTVLDPNVDYDASEAHKIAPYELDGKTFASLDDLANISGDTNDIKRADIVWNWFKDNSTGDHFTKISQTGIEQYTGAYEGATMFKFIDRDEWCVMIDYYGSMKVRYEPYTTTDLSNPDSITKVTSGYGRTGGDIGTHGGMIPITVEEYNNIIKTYNNDPSVENYHKISYIEVDKSELDAKATELTEKAATNAYSDGVKAQMTALAEKAAEVSKDDSVSSEDVEKLIARADKLLNNKKVSLPAPAEKPAPAPVTSDEMVDLPAVKSTCTVGTVKYQVASVDEYNTDGTNGKVTVTGTTKKNATSVVIPDEIEINGYTFAVTKINAKAFQNCKKLKNITIGDNVKNIGNNAFKGINKKATFKVSSDNYAKVKRILKKKVGFKKPMKIKEI